MPDGFESKNANLRAVEAVAQTSKKPIAYVTMISHGMTDYSREIRADLAHLPFLQEPDKALRAIRSIATMSAAIPTRRTVAYRPSARPRASVVRQAITSAGAQARALSEVESKALLRAYGIRSPKEAVVDICRCRGKGGTFDRLSGRAEGRIG